MGTSGSWPNFDAWLQTAWGSGSDFCVVLGYPNATNLVFGQNPPWYLDDLLLIYPKFFGPPSTYSLAGTVSGSTTVTLPSTTGLTAGAFIQAAGVLPPNTVITSVSTGSIVVSNAALVTMSNVVFIAYTTMRVPSTVLNIYIALATASLQSVRWQEQWYLAMALFVAHYATLWVRSDAIEVIQTVQASIHGEVPAGPIPGTAFTLSSIPPGDVLQSLTKNGLFLSPGVDYTLIDQAITLLVALQTGDVLYATWPSTSSVNVTVWPTSAQVAAQGLANGILTSKSVGDVSGSYQALTSLESWGQWNLTLYGQQLATMAKVIGMGPMVIW
jgi:hypothetical protein